MAPSTATEVALSTAVADRASGRANAPALTSSASGADRGRGRLAGLDGLRGLAALYVVVHHIFLRAFPGYPVDHAPFWAASVPAFVVSLALALPLTVVCARPFARIFERQPWPRRNWSPAARGQRVRVDGAPG